MIVTGLAPGLSGVGQVLSLRLLPQVCALLAASIRSLLWCCLIFRGVSGIIIDGYEH